MVTLADDELLAADELGRRLTDHEARYAPAVSLVARFRARRHGLLVMGAGSGGGGDDMDMDDDDDDGDEEGIDFEGGATVGTGVWPIRSVTFSVRAGEALGVVGERSAVETLMHVVSGMGSPSTGAFAYRGRRGTCFELARSLIRQESGAPGQILRLLATLGGVPRRERKAWVQAALDLVGGGEPPGRWRWREKEQRIRIATAATLDPTANVLLVDRVPGREDMEFRRRCLTRLKERLDAGASALVTCADLDAMVALCDRMVWLSGGSVVAAGPAKEIISRYRSALDDSERVLYASVPSFDSTVAIHDVSVVSEGRKTDSVDGSEPFTVHAELETAKPELTVSCRLRLDGPATVAVPQREPQVLVAPGRYAARLGVPAGAVGDGDYRVAVEVIALASNSERSVVIGTLPTLLRVRDTSAAGPEEVDTMTSDWSIVGVPDLDLI